MGDSSFSNSHCYIKCEFLKFDGACADHTGTETDETETYISHFQDDESGCRSSCASHSSCRAYQYDSYGKCATFSSSAVTMGDSRYHNAKCYIKGEHMNPEA
mmetsp:Transcript_126580/g.405181  ORF Transcript_126580/g.405181 Transcript_126580/m.405181 type:complete len:102 (-) Transcript_126580:42-347(-)